MKQTVLYVSSLKFHVLQMNQLVKNSWLIPTTKCHELPHLCGLIITPLLIYLLANFLIPSVQSSYFSFWCCIHEDLIIDFLLKWKSWLNSRFPGLQYLTTRMAGMYHGSSYVLLYKVLQAVLIWEIVCISVTLLRADGWVSDFKFKLCFFLISCLYSLQMRWRRL